ncbi:hypothetical protein AB832_06935 [Flavobacteriaceae bacterium (ex Bugula neritina AB1)]|nr:hypothetical protein AB832_06935 [Flavobacteriaceae bacterium (ex Bugula neritina AB1)]
MATLTQISNILNLMAQQPNSGLLYYHHGYRYDINREVSNNFDQDNRIGRMYPALQMDVPNFFNDLAEEEFFQVQQDIEMVLYFDKLQDYDNNGNLDNRNTIEQMDYLKTIARNFMANLTGVFALYEAGFIKTPPRYVPRANLHNPKLITLECTFTLTTELECVPEVDKMDLSLFPQAVSKVDIENWKA